MSGKSAIRFAAGTASLAAGGWLLRALQDAPASLGAGPSGVRGVAQNSPNYRDGVFHNLEPASMIKLDAIDAEANRQVLFEMLSRRSPGRPGADIPLADPVGSRTEPLSVTWYGHSSVLVEVDGYRVLTDPIWSDRCSPSRTVGPQRLHPNPTPLEALPALDAVLISHDHYDHLDMDTVVRLARSQRSPFVVPLGVGAHLRDWGIPPHRVIELDWNEQTRIDDLTLVCTPARHFSGRFMVRNTTLWSSWVLRGPEHRVYFGGDTGYSASFEHIGADHGPFDITLMPIGAYNTAWPDIHMNPEEAVRAHRDMTDAGLLIPIHWCTFRLAPHPWAEPVERLLSAAQSEGLDIAVPKPGGRVAPGSAPTERWWRL
ncbi:MAG: MBL fold metallo-hydrolase [Mycobacterium sp.]